MVGYRDIEGHSNSAMGITGQLEGFVYSGFSKGNGSALILAVDNPEKAFHALESAWIRLLDFTS